jgi:hypothetical protein
MGEVQRILVNEIDDTPGGAHHNVHATAQLLQLGADGVAAVVAAQLEGGGGGGDLALNLQVGGGGGEARRQAGRGKSGVEVIAGQGVEGFRGSSNSGEGKDQLHACMHRQAAAPQ